MEKSAHGTNLETRAELEDANLDGEPVLHWKRIVTTGVVLDLNPPVKFAVILDIRSGLLTLTKRTQSPTPASEIAAAYLYHLASYTTTPFSRLFVPRRSGNEDKTVLWMVSDAEKVSGLMHRVGEDGEFEGPSSPPMSPAVETMLAHLVKATDLGLREVLWWHESMESRRPSYGLSFGTSVWESYLFRFREEMDDIDAVGRFGRFFEIMVHYRELTATILQAAEFWKPTVKVIMPGAAYQMNTASVARARLNHLRDEALALGSMLCQTHASAQQRLVLKHAM